MPLSKVSRFAAILAPNSDAEMYSVMGWASNRTIAGSIAAASRRTAAIVSFTDPEVRT